MNTSELGKVADFIRTLYPDETPVPLHAPRFFGNEKRYLSECIDTTFVSYVGQFVRRFEESVCALTGANHAIAVVNGTAALQVALLAAGVDQGSLVITQAMTFVATANAIVHCGATPAFVDVDRSTLGMSPSSLSDFLEKNAGKRGGACFDRASGKRISACVPMHTFGHAAEVDSIVHICDRFGIPVVEDAAESIGTLYKGRHTGLFGKAGVLSFNGNKPITTGGGGMVLSNDAAVAAYVRHITTTAKSPHPWEFFHDTVAFNYRMPNINAAVGLAQIECFDTIVENKRATAAAYEVFFADIGIPLIKESPQCRSNYWLNAIQLRDKDERDSFLAFTNDNGIQTRPIWKLMTHLPMFKDCLKGDLSNSLWLEERIVNIPSSVRVGANGAE